MGFITDIESCIASDAILTGEEKNFLTENGTSTKVQLKTEGNYINCDFEKLGNPLFPFFNRNKADLCKISDNVLFFEKQDKLWCLIIELKEKGGSPKKQLLATRLLVKYIIESTNRVCKKNYTLEFRMIGYSKKIRPKTKAKIKYQEGFIQIGGLGSIYTESYLI